MQVRSNGHASALRNNIGGYPAGSERVKAAPTCRTVQAYIVQLDGVFPGTGKG
jgi:hypothetical protein